MIQRSHICCPYIEIILGDIDIIDTAFPSGTRVVPINSNTDSQNSNDNLIIIAQRMLKLHRGSKNFSGDLEMQSLENNLGWSSKQSRRTIERNKGIASG